MTRRSVNAVLRSLEEGLIVLDGEGRVRAANPAALTLLGATSEAEARGLDAVDLIGHDRLEAESRLGLAMRGADPAMVETVLRRIDGTPVPAELSLAPVRMADGPARVVCVARDIRERLDSQRMLAASEERYRRLVELAPDGIVVVRDGKVVFVNAAGAACLGGGDPGQVIGKALVYFLEPNQRDGAAAQIEGVARSGIGVVSHEQRWLTADGHPFDAEVAATPMVFDGADAVLLVVRDVSERRSIERMKDEFVATVSHELRTPLTSILGSLGLLLGGVSGELSDEARSMLEVADRNGRRLLRLINDLLDLEKLEAGRMTFRIEQLSLVSLVEHAVEANRGYAAAHGVTLEVIRATAESAEVRVDAERLLQVLANLLSNAVKFAPGGSAVTVRIRRLGDGFEVGVRDRGPGIPEALAPRLFERFVQADVPERRRTGSTGLGLAISRTIVERMGGSIGFRSPVDGGTEFWFRLPAAEQPVEGV